MTCTPRNAARLLLAISAFAAGCGGGSGGDEIDGGASAGTTSGVTGSKKLPQLTDADKKAICDWTAGLYGGYGKSIDCGSSGGMSLTITGPVDLAECLAEAALVPSTCQATVAQSEPCVKVMATCERTNMATVCAATLACLPTSP